MDSIKWQDGWLQDLEAVALRWPSLALATGNLFAYMVPNILMMNDRYSKDNRHGYRPV